ncbi:MAG: hypothetical protein FWF44_06530 [Defluviitaleaceae bacterium]|nr:hypothetical protein [Defluviitaleaceae bacterium]
MEHTAHICGSCKKFMLHYVRDSRGSYRALSYGHCAKPSLNKKYAERPACEYYEEKQERTEK